MKIKTTFRTKFTIIQPYGKSSSWETAPDLVLYYLQKAGTIAFEKRNLT